MTFHQAISVIICRSAYAQPAACAPMFGYKGGNYSIKVSFGTFSISLENGNRIPEPVPVRRRKRPSAIKRDKNRRIEFLKNKNFATSSCPFSSGVNTFEETRVLDLQPPVTLPTDEKKNVVFSLRVVWNKNLGQQLLMVDSSNCNSKQTFYQNNLPLFDFDDNWILRVQCSEIGFQHT